MTRKGFRSRRSAKSDWKLTLLSVFLVIFVAGGFYAAYLFYSTIRDVVAHAQLGGPVISGTGSAQTDLQPTPDIAQERVNILLLGTDQRSGENGPSRTDTMIVVTVDPQTKSGGMLSIPRDLWVSIPGHSEGRINTAHFYGEADDYPGGGPALAKKTVQYALGVPIHYYVRVNFDGFVKLVDAINGITINVEEPIHDDRYPDGSYGYMTIDIPAGEQLMDGQTALQYARARHGGSDFQRARRQQQVLKAIRDKVMRLDIPLTKIPEMLRIVGDSVRTDLSLSDMYALAKLGREIDVESIRSAVIDETLTTPQTTPDGAQVLIPDRALMREVIKDLFGGPAPTSVASLTEAQLLARDGAKVEVQNGTLTPGLAQSTAEQLTIIDYSGKSSTVSLLAQRFKVAAENIRRQSDGPPGVDVRLILGQDSAATPAP